MPDGPPIPPADDRTVRLAARFRVDSWEQEPYAEEPDGTLLSRIRLRKEYTGDLAATGLAEMLSAQGGAGQGYVAQEWVTGSLAGRSGSFVLHHGALNGEGEPQQWAVVVPGSATGELAGLTGSGVMHHRLLALDYRLP